MRELCSLMILTINKFKMNEENKIEFLKFPENIRSKAGMYIGSIQREGVNTCLREITDNACDEIGAGFGDTVHVSNNFNGFNYVADNSTRGIPIKMSEDVPEKTQAYLSISEIHSSGKFQAGDVGRVGINGIGSSATAALSEIYCLLVRVTEKNKDGSIPEVLSAWESSGPRQRGELYYVVICERGYKVFENCLTLREIEKKLFGKDYIPIPRGMTTIVLFKLDSTIFECSVTPEIPYTNLNYFLLIQTRFFGRKKIQILIDGKPMVCNFKPYKYEISGTVTPRDPNSPNKEVGVYLTFEMDPSLDKSEFASVNGLDCRVGYHVNLAKNLFKSALKSQYKVTHEYALEGLRFGVIILANDCVFSSQTKENLKSITKVKTDDFSPIVKEIEKIMKKNKDDFDLYVSKVNALWDSKRSIGAIEKAQKMIDGASGTSIYKSRANMIEGFSDATLRDRWDCELYIVEGNSPAGSLKSGRKTISGGLKEAVLPLRGKVLNVSDVDINRALENKEISTLFQILGVGIQENNVTTGTKTWEEAHEKLMKHSRYGKICISTDADADKFIV